MATERATRNASLAAETAAAANVWADTVTEKLEELLGPYLEQGEQMPDVILLQKLIGRLLEGRRQQVQKKDGQSHQQEVAAAFARRDRDRAVKALREELRHARYFLDRAGDPGSEGRHGLGEGLSWMAPHLLVTLGEQTVRLLGRHAEGETPATLASPAALAAAVGEKTAALERALAALNPERIQESVSRHEKKIEIQQTEKTIRRTAAFLGELYKLAGCEDFAERVRPTFRKRRKPTKQESEALALQPAPLPPLPVEAELVREEPRIELRLVAGNEEQVLPLPLLWLSQWTAGPPEPANPSGSAGVSTALIQDQERAGRPRSQ